MSFWDLFRPKPPADLSEQLRGISSQLELTMTKISEVKGIVDELHTQLDKARTEIVTKLEDFENRIVNTELPDDAVASLTALRGSVQALDDIVPDAPPAPEPPPPEAAA